MFDIPQVGHLSSHIVWSTMAADMDCGGSKVGGGAEMTCSVLVRPARSLAEDSGSGLACASMFGPRCACLGSSESNFQKRGQIAGGAIRQRAAFKVCEVPSANDVLARPPFSMPS